MPSPTLRPYVLSILIDAPEGVILYIVAGVPAVDPEGYQIASSNNLILCPLISDQLLDITG